MQITDFDQDLKKWVEAQVTEVHLDLSLAYMDYRKLLHVTFTVGGVKPQGEPLSVLTSSKEKAIELFQREFLLYLAQFEGPTILQWRYYPTVASHTYTPDGGEPRLLFSIMSRFSVAGY